MNLLAVLLNWRTPDMTLRALDALLTELRPIAGARVCIVDNDSRDGSFDKLTAAVKARGLSDIVDVVDSGHNGGFGFGNNGGEEFLSYMMSSESLVSSGGKPWDERHHKMSNLFSAIQNPNGSWSGHHCITSPVFCTAAVVMTLTADRNPETK